MPRPPTQSLFRALNAVVGPVVRAGVGSPLPLSSGVVMVETTGRTSGRPRRVPLLAWRRSGDLYVSTVREDSQWVRNLEAEPQARVWLFGRSREVRSTLHRSPLGTVARLKIAA